MVLSLLASFVVPCSLVLIENKTDLFLSKPDSYLLIVDAYIENSEKNIIILAK